MSTYTKLTKHPITWTWENAEWRDDWFGKHRYGVYFPSDEKVYDPRAVGLEIADWACNECEFVLNHKCD